jgi:hypothetical protein
MPPRRYVAKSEGQSWQLFQASLLIKTLRPGAASEEIPHG